MRPSSLSDLKTRCTIPRNVDGMLSISGASMVHMIDRLVKAGLVMREPSISDRRVNRIVITDAGHRLYAELKDEAAAVRQQLVASIELEKLVHLTELLEQLQCIFQPARAYPQESGQPPKAG
jgi:MarR family transcriptional regulator, transcriptional regulator for hemolysin